MYDENMNGKQNDGQEGMIVDSEARDVRVENVADIEVREVQKETVVAAEAEGVQAETMANAESAEGQEETVVNAESAESQEETMINAESETSFVFEEAAGNRAENETVQDNQDHQYRYGRSYYQNQQDSIYHTNEAENQGNNQNQGNMYHYSNGNAGSTNQNQGGGINQHGNMNQGYTQAGNGPVHQNYNAGPSMNQVQQPLKKKNSDSHTLKKVLKVAACVVIMAAVGAGSAVGTTIWLDGRNEEYTETSSVTTQKNSAIPVSTISANTAVVTDVSNVVENTMPSVVKITNVGTQTYNGFFGGTYEYESNGSGIIIGQTEEELLVVTNQHVVAGADTLQVIFIDETACEANVKGTDAEKDLAVIAVPVKSLKEETLDQIKVATMGDSESVKVGEPAIAIGNALGYGQSVTLGVISAKDREVKTEDYTNKLIQTDAAINPGNSGGALLNIAGEVIGINSVKYSSTEVEGMGYAIPISDAMPIINELMNKETKTKVDEAKKSYMGVSGVDITSDVAQAYNMPKGVYVAQVTKDSPADKAGLKKGDIITKIADVSVTSFDELKAELEYHEAGSTVKVDILTQSKNSYGYESKSVDVTLAKRED